MASLHTEEEKIRTSNVERGYEVCGVLGRRNKPCQRVGQCPFHGTKGSLTLKNGFNICTDDNQVQYFDLPVSAASWMMEQIKQKRRKVSVEGSDSESNDDHRSAPSSPLPSSLPSSPAQVFAPSSPPRKTNETHFPPAAVISKNTSTESESSEKSTTRGLPSISSLLNPTPSVSNAPQMYSNSPVYPTSHWTPIPPLTLAVPVYPQQFVMRNPYLVQPNIYSMPAEFNSNAWQAYSTQQRVPSNPLKRSFNNTDIARSSFPSVIQLVN